MNFQAIIIATVIVAVVGLIIGLMLGFAGEKLAVKVDENEVAVRQQLPGNNCGGCGYAGCDGLAAAIAKGEAPVNACPVGGVAVAEKISAIMGVDAGASVKMVAFVKCAGTCDKTTIKYNYYGIHDCKKMALIPGGGDKSCQSGCLGYGSCVNACQFDAIHIVDGIALVDKEKCVACGKCVAQCPRNLIEIVPYDAPCKVACSSHDKGKDVKAVCDAGCIGCGMCARVCECGAVTVEDNLARIDYGKCTGCGKCAQKCPTKVIHME